MVSKIKIKDKEYFILKASRFNLRAVERFTNGEVKCQSENFTHSGECEIYIEREDTTIWCVENSYLLKDKMNKLSFCGESEIKKEDLVKLNLKEKIKLWLQR